MAQTSRFYTDAVSEKEGVLTKDGVLVVKSGDYTARYASGKYVVDEPTETVSYNDYHQRICKKTFMAYWHKATQHISKKYTSGNYQVGNHPLHNIHVNVKTELNWHQVFASHLFLPQTESPLERWELICAPSLCVSQTHPVFIGICCSERKVLISGTGYAGEIKKAMFSVANIRFPDKDVLPLHCSAVISPKKTTSLLLGLSGTGKTTLSTSDNVTIIGDDEHGWANDGVFNLEGGCYAKVINLSEKNERQIYKAIKPPAILENVILREDNSIDFTDSSITENTRVSYPILHLPNYSLDVAPHPKDIIFLCCDVYGAIPAVSLLTQQQALSFFAIGYTAKIGATEVNADAVKHVSSPCFGMPFLPRPLSVYQKLFKKRIQQHNCRVWLVNSGWGSGGVTHGNRYPISTTRTIIQDIVNQELSANIMELHPKLGLHYITRTTTGELDIGLPKFWTQSKQFDASCDLIKKIFHDALNKYSPDLLKIGID